MSIPNEMNDISDWYSTLTRERDAEAQNIQN
jgi:hypothetical protein